MSVIQQILNHRSIRKYKPDPIPEVLLQEIDGLKGLMPQWEGVLARLTSRALVVRLRGWPREW